MRLPSFLVCLINSVKWTGSLYRNFFSVVLGPKLGARGMVQSRFSWGYVDNTQVLEYRVDHAATRYYGAIIPSILNVLSMQGYVIINCIVGGQTLAAVSPSHLSPAAGIVITGLIALGVSMSNSPIATFMALNFLQVTFCGYQILHW